MKQKQKKPIAELLKKTEPMSRSSSESAPDSEYENPSDAEDLEDYKKDGYHPVQIGETFHNGRFQVVQKLGWGHFSTVWLVFDKQLNTHQALKIQKSKISYQESALDELQLLTCLRQNENSALWKTFQSYTVNYEDLKWREETIKAEQGVEIRFPDENHCVKMIDNFIHYGMHGKHYCTVFEVLGPTLLDLIIHFDDLNRKMPIWLVKQITREVLIGLVYMHDICNMIHTDLKPENLMIQLEQNSLGQFVEQMKMYKKKPLSMKFLDKLKKTQKGSKKQEKKKKQKQKKLLQQQPQQVEVQQTQQVAESQVDGSANLQITQPTLDTQLTNQKESSQVLENISEVKQVTIDDSKQEANQTDETQPIPVTDKIVDKKPKEKHVSRAQEQKQQKQKKNSGEDSSDFVTESEGESGSDSESDSEVDDETLYNLIWKEHIKIPINRQLSVKIVDFGNACWTHKHFTDNIQTREYRSPEAILGIEYDATTDIWSLACVVFELLTNDYLFKPKKGKGYTKTDDHLAQMMETLGKMNKKFALSGQFSRDYFNKNGQLSNIKDLSTNTIDMQLIEDHGFSIEDAIQIEDFLRPMLEFEPKKRWTARQMLMHPWLWKKRVAYFYHPHIGRFHYGKEHPMKPKRIAMAHNLIVNYGLYRNLDVYMNRAATVGEMLKFHEQDYIDYLKQYIAIQPSSTVIQEFQHYSNVKNINLVMNDFTSHLRSEFDMVDYNQQPCWMRKETNNMHPQQNNFRVGDSTDNPQFPGLYNFCQLSAGASIDAAHVVISGDADIAINWSGGLHHAKKSEASGFCYVNDIVIAILELLRVHTRVLYIDIDVHHGDGVEEAFLLTNRVMTCSFHQYGDDFFPGSGNLDSYGEGLGRYHSLNIPLKVGMNDETFTQLFRQIISRVLESYKPEAIVLQCGADSLCHDRLGGFNLSVRGHGECVDFIRAQGRPTLVLGGGGYTIQNVARCWAYETGVCLGRKIDAPIPTSEVYYEYYSPDYKLHFPIKTNLENKNKKDDLNKIVEKIFDYLKEVEQAPGICFHDTVQSYYPDMDHHHENDPDRKNEMSLNQFEGAHYQDGESLFADLDNGFQIHKRE